MGDTKDKFPEQISHEVIGATSSTVTYKMGVPRLEDPIKLKRTKKTQLITYVEELCCPVKGCKGTLIKGNYGVSTNVTEWLHKCDTCGVEYFIVEDSFPRIVQERVKVGGWPIKPILRRKSNA